MTQNYLVPLKMTPFLRETLWGGQKLRQIYGKDDPKLANIAEAWEVSTHPHGLSGLDHPPFAATTFADYLQLAGPKAISSQAKSIDFPLIIKYIDAMDDLSIQVHPGYGYAAPHDPGKTEMWYVVAAEPGATLYYGVKDIISLQELRNRIENDTLPEILNQVPVHAGDCFFLPPGTIHGIGRGILIAEIQQACDLTYRVCDYGRIDRDGKKRPLHIKDALAVSTLSPTQATIPGKVQTLVRGNTLQQLVSCDYFTVTRLHLQAALTHKVSKNSFTVIMTLEGAFQLTHESVIYTYHQGETAYLPAGMGEYTLDGQAELLLATL